MSAKLSKNALTFLLLLTAASARADGPSFWTDNSRADFMKGKPEGVSILENETLALAPELRTRAALGEPVVWSLVLDGKGRVWAGTGHDGKLLRLEANGDTILVRHFEEPEVSALALDTHSGAIYAATSPEGRVYRVSADGATAEVWFDPPEKYIWALLVAPDGVLYAAAGPSATVYRIVGSGKGQAVLRSDDQHIIALALDRSGNLLAGSSGKGLLYQVSPAGAVSILYDSQMKDIRSILVDKDNGLFVTAFTMQSPGEQPSPLLPPQAARSGQSASAVEQKEGDSGQDQDKQAGQFVIQMPAMQLGESASSEIYFFDTDRFPTRIWQGSGETLLAAGLDSRGRVLFVSTKDKSNLCSVDRLGDQALLCPFPDDQATAFLCDPSGGRTLIATSNMGKILELSGGCRSEGSFQSQVYNAGLPAEWGAITWKGDSPEGAQVRFRTRSGNTSRPDTTWSAWSAPFSPGMGAQIQSPARMYFQWEAILSSRSAGASPSVEEVNVSYLRRNRPPLLSRIKFMPQGVFIRKGGSGSSSGSEILIVDMPDEAEQLVNPKKNSGSTSNPFSGKKEYARGMRMAGWNASDANGDELRYSVYFRGVDESAWRPLALGLSDNALTWSTESMSDGWYVLKVTAMDSTDNPGARACLTERVSERFLVDNTPPVAEKISLSRSQGKAVVLTFEAADAVGRIGEAQVSLDGERWRAVFPQDGIADTPRESYREEFGNLAPGEHTVAVQILDEFHNTATFSRSIKMP
ncbi:SMP-30/gluconolactonase/LRE family protein [bacterium]|nr:SMP-30/gluconolactonase/LRE family protein [bacterium]